MGLPDPSPIASPAEAFAAVALAAMACDGDLSVLEARSLRQQLEFRYPYRQLGDNGMAQLLDKLLQLLREQGWEALVQQAAPHLQPEQAETEQGWEALVQQAAPHLQPEQAETALAVAATLTQADHVESRAEVSFLHTLSAALAVEPERARMILDVVSILNRDSLAS